MDFLIYICLLIVIAALFFVNNFTSGKNAIMFAFLFSMFGWVFLTLSPPEIILGTNTTLIFDGSNQVIGSTATFITQPFTILGFEGQSFFYLVFFGTMAMSIALFFMDKDFYGEKEAIDSTK